MTNGYCSADDPDNPNYDGNRPISPPPESVLTTLLAARDREIAELKEEVESLRGHAHDAEEAFKQWSARENEIAEQAKRIEQLHADNDSLTIGRQAALDSYGTLYTLYQDQAKRIACLEAELEKCRKAWVELRDCVLNDRHQLAESDMGSDRTNAVLGLMDDLSDPALAPGPSAQDQSSVDHFEDAKRTVASWPQWKRDVFSRALADPQRPSQKGLSHEPDPEM